MNETEPIPSFIYSIGKAASEFACSPAETQEDIRIVGMNYWTSMTFTS